MQISQFLFGATYAAAHLFVKYDIPIATAYTILHPIASMLSEATSTASEIAASATSIAASPLETYGAFLKRILLRAAGEEGVAENVRDGHGQVVLQGAKEAVQKYHEETRWSTDYHTINCIDTTGASFAVWLNLIYLAPLTVLFMRFFIRAYTQRSGTGTKKQSKRHAAGRSAIEAAKGVDREVDEVSKYAERKLSDRFEELDAEVKKDLQKLRDGTNSAKSPSNKSPNRPVSEQVKSIEQRAMSLTKEQAAAAKRAISGTPTKKGTAQIKQDAADSIDELKENVKASKAKSESSDSRPATSESKTSLDESKSSLSESKNSFDSDGAAMSDSMSASQTTSSKKKRKNKKKKSNKAAANGTTGAESHDDESEDDDHEAENNADVVKEEATPEFKKEDPAGGA